MKIKVAKFDSLQELIENFNNLLEETEEAPEKECAKQCEAQCEAPNDGEVLEGPEGMELTDDVYMVNDNYFILTNKVKGINITDNTDLIFNHLKGERFVPGITEEQLLTVLLYKNRNNKERYELIKQLLFN